MLNVILLKWTFINRFIFSGSASKKMSRVENHWKSAFLYISISIIRIIITLKSFFHVSPPYKSDLVFQKWLLVPSRTFVPMQNLPDVLQNPNSRFGLETAPCTRHVLGPIQTCWEHAANRSRRNQLVWTNRQFSARALSHAVAGPPSRP